LTFVDIFLTRKAQQQQPEAGHIAGHIKIACGQLLKKKYPYK